MTYSAVAPNLYLIPLDQKMTEFHQFISAWLFKSDEITFLVDPGPHYSIKQLVKNIKEIGATRIDYILLTHIHIDHAGGTGDLLKHYPGARIICHPMAFNHMISPEKLWEGSLKTLGGIATSYGEITPVKKDALDFMDRIETETGNITVFETPGHAPHHLCFQFQNYLFAGEVAGVAHCLKEGIYARPATPPKFKLKTSVTSIDRMRSLDASMICYGHYGFRLNAENALNDAREQLLLWVEIVKNHMTEESGISTDRMIQTLMREDPAFANITYFPEDIRRREIYFVGNTLKGMTGYLNTAIS